MISCECAHLALQWVQVMSDISMATLFIFKAVGYLRLNAKSPGRVSAAGPFQVDEVVVR